jgi:Flp pilus assembly protein protease CpaA
VPGILIASKFTVRIPNDVLRLGLAGVLSLSGLKLLNVPEAKWVLGIGIVVVLGGLAAYGVNAWLSRPRVAPVRSLE